MIGDAAEKTAKKKLQCDLDWLKKNVKEVGSIDRLKVQYPKGYKKIYSIILDDVNSYRDACFAGYQVDTLISSEDIYVIWGNRNHELNMIIKNDFSADKITTLIKQFLDELQETYKGLIYLVNVEKETTQKEGKA